MLSPVVSAVNIARNATNLDVPSRLGLAISGAAAVLAARVALVGRRAQRVALSRQRLGTLRQRMTELPTRTPPY